MLHWRFEMKHTWQNYLQNISLYNQLVLLYPDEFFDIFELSPKLLKFFLLWVIVLARKPVQAWVPQEPLLLVIQVLVIYKPQCNHTASPK